MHTERREFRPSVNERLIRKRIMLRDGWVEVTKGVDFRSRIAKITHKGAQVLAMAGKGWDGVQCRLIRRFGKDEWQKLLTELNRLAECTKQ